MNGAFRGGVRGFLASLLCVAALGSLGLPAFAQDTVKGDDDRHVIRERLRKHRSEDLDTLVISRGPMHRDAGSGSSETLVVGRGRGTVDINLGRRGHIQIDDDDDRRGDLVLMGDDIFVEKDQVVDGDAVAVGGSVTVLGKVLGDVVAVGGNVSVGDSAVIAGDAVSVGGEVNRSDSSVIGGEVTMVGIDMPFFKIPRTQRQGSAMNLVRWIVFYLIIFAAAALAIYLAKDRIGYASSYLGREPFPAFLLGLVSPFMALVAFVLLCITVIGIPVALAMILLYPVFLFVGWVVTGHRIGAAVKNDSAVNVRNVFTGLLVISGLHMFYVLLRTFDVGGLPIFLIQVAGITVSFTSALVGLGAILGTRFRRPQDVMPQPVYPGTPPMAPLPPSPVIPPGSTYVPPGMTGMSTPHDPTTP